MKTCFKCGADKPLGQFYVDARMSDGHLGKCKECTKLDVRRNRAARVAHYREFDRRRFREDPERRAATYATTRRLKKQYRDRERARDRLAKAVRAGRIIRQPCEVCGAQRVEGHHPDYSRPLDVRWLCTEHHNAVHHPAPF